MATRRTAASAPIESKVTAATAAAAVTPLALWLLATYLFDGSVPEPVAGAVVFLVPGLVTFLAGWAARHTPRPGLVVPDAPGGANGPVTGEGPEDPGSPPKPPSTPGAPPP